MLHKRVDRRFLELNPETHRKVEAQAFRFAGAFLMPETTFRQSVPYVSLDTLLMIKPEWNLSVAAMLHRAQDLRIVDGSIAQNLWINLTRRGWKNKEPLEESIAPEEPKLLGNALIAIQSSLGVGALSKLVGLSPQDYERFAGLQKNALCVSTIREFNPVRRTEQRETKLAYEGWPSGLRRPS